MLGFFVKSNSDFSFYKKLLLRIINKCLTFDVELNDLALTTTDSIECLTGDLTRTSCVNRLRAYANILGFFVKSSSDFSIYKKNYYVIINKCLTFDV